MRVLTDETGGNLDDFDPDPIDPPDPPPPTPAPTPDGLSVIHIAGTTWMTRSAQSRSTIGPSDVGHFTNNGVDYLEGRKDGQYLRYHADLLLNDGTAPPSNVQSTANRWAAFDPTLSLPVSSTQNAIIAAYVMNGILWSSADLGIVPNNTQGWHDRLKFILSDPDWRWFDSLRTNIMACYLGSVAVLGHDQQEIVDAAADTSANINRNISNVNRQNHEEFRERSLHFSMLDINHLVLQIQYFRNHGVDLSASAYAELIPYFEDLWDWCDGFIDKDPQPGDGDPFLYSNNGGQREDNGSVVHSMFNYTQKVAILLGLHSGTPAINPVVLSNSPTPYEPFARAPEAAAPPPVSNLGRSIVVPFGTSRATRPSATPSIYVPGVHGNLTSPNNYFRQLASSSPNPGPVAAPPDDLYVEAGIPAAKFCRYQADRKLEDLTPDSNAATLVEAWSTMNPGNAATDPGPAGVSLHTGTEGTGASSINNGRMATAVQVMPGIFWAARDLEVVPSGAIAWRDRAEEILNVAGWRKDHNFRAGVIEVMASANAAMNNSLDTKLSDVKTFADAYILESFPRTGVNDEEDARTRGLHYQCIDLGHIAPVHGYLLNEGSDLSSAAIAKLQNHMAFHWPNFQAVLNGAALPYPWVDGDGNSKTDIGPIENHTFGTMMEWAIALGWHAGPLSSIPAGARGEENRRNDYAYAPT